MIRSVTWICLATACALLVGCGDREASRLQAAGLYEEIDPASIPPAGLVIMEIPVNDGAGTPDGMPLIERDGRRYSVVLIDRQRIFCETGKRLPDPQQRPRAVDNPARAFERARIAIDALTRPVNTLRAAEEQALASEDNAGALVARRKHDVALVRLNSLRQALDAWISVTAEHVPDQGHAARFDQQFAEAKRASTQADVLVQVLITTHAVALLQRGVAERGALLASHADDEAWWALMDRLRVALQMTQSAIDARDPARAIAAARRARDLATSVEQTPTWSSIMTASSRMAWIRTPTDDELSATAAALEAVRNATQAAWRQVAVACLDAAPVQDVPVLVYDSAVSPFARNTR